jgi:hypothetical protein
MQTLLCLVPQEAWLPLMVLAGILVIVGFKSIGGKIFVGIILLALLAPFAEGLIEALPTPLLLLLLIALPFIFFRMIFGRRVTENILSAFLWTLIKAPFRFLGWLLRSPARRP